MVIDLESSIVSEARMKTLKDTIERIFANRFDMPIEVRIEKRLIDENRFAKRNARRLQNEFIEKAIRFYAGYVSSGEAIDYLPPALVAALRGTVEDSEHRIARLLFKLAVETSMMMNVLAAGMEISEEDLRQLRARCVREVKQTNGNISLKDAVKYQKGQE